jgi:hypothetical protein
MDETLEKKSTLTKLKEGFKTFRTPSNTTLFKDKSDDTFSWGKFLTPVIDTGVGKRYAVLSKFFPFDAESYAKNPDYDINKDKINTQRNEIKEKLDKYKVKFEDTFKRGKENIIKKRDRAEVYSRDDSIRAEDDAKGLTAYMTSLVVAMFKWFADATISAIRNAFTTGWNKTITGFLIIVFIVLLIFVFPKMKSKKKQGGKNEPTDIMSILMNIPRDISLAFSEFSLAFGEMRDSVNNATETLTSTVSSMSAPMPDLLERERAKDGRGADNLFHIKGAYIKGTSATDKDNIEDNKIYNIYKPSGQYFHGTTFISKAITDIPNKYELDCASIQQSSDVDSNCVLKTEAPPPPPTNTVDTTDYINIELKEGS